MPLATHGPGPDLRQVAKISLRAFFLVVSVCFVAAAQTSTPPQKDSAPSAKKSSTGTAGNHSSKAPSKSSSKSKHSHSTHKSKSRERAQRAPTPERISEIQSALAGAGHYSGAPTGKWDASTIQAMKHYQQANGLAPTGKLDAHTLEKLGLGSPITGVSAPRPPATAPPATPPAATTPPSTAPSTPHP
jgi:hypothetical protein